MSYYIQVKLIQKFNVSNNINLRDLLICLYIYIGYDTCGSRFNPVNTRLFHVHIYFVFKILLICWFETRWHVGSYKLFERRFEFLFQSSIFIDVCVLIGFILYSVHFLMTGHLVSLWHNIFQSNYIITDKFKHILLHVLYITKF